MLKKLLIFCVTFVSTTSLLCALEVRHEFIQGEVYNSKIIDDLAKHSSDKYADSDPITNAHERTHGACSRYRDKYGVKDPRGNAFYLLNDVVGVYMGPTTTLEEGIKKTIKAGKEC